MSITFLSRHVAKAGDTLVSLVSEYRFRGLLGVPPDLSPADMDAHAQAVAEAFLKAFGAD